MTTLKKSLALVLAFIFGLTLFPALPVFATETTTPSPTPSPNVIIDSAQIPQSSSASPQIAFDKDITFPDTAPAMQVRNSEEPNIRTNLSWALAAIAAVEKATGISMASENHMRFALSNENSNANGFSRKVNGAGSRSMVAAYLMRGVSAGPVTFSDDQLFGYEYTTRDNTITSSKTPATRVDGVVYIPGISYDAVADDRDIFNARVQNALSDYGSVVASFYYNEQYFVGEKYTVNDVYEYTDSQTANTTVLIVGCAPDKGFLVQDPIGKKQYYISYDTPLYDAYAIQKNASSTASFEKTYEYDPFGLTSIAGFNSPSTYFANVFTVGKSDEKLSAVSFFVAGEDATADIYLVPVMTANITTDLKKAVEGAVPVKGNVKFDLPGYYTVDLSSVTSSLFLGNAGSKFAVIVKVSTPDATKLVPLEGKTTLTSNATSAANQSFFSADGTSWVDAHTNAGSNVCLKAHTIGNQTIAPTELTFERLKNTNPDSSDTDSPTEFPYVSIEKGKTFTLRGMLLPANQNTIKDLKYVYGILKPGENGEPDVFVDIIEGGDKDENDKPIDTKSPTEFFTLTSAGVLTAHDIPTKPLEGLDPDRDAHTRVRVRLVDKNNDTIIVDGKAMEAVADVIIFNNGVTGVTLSKTTLSVKTNSKATLSATVAPSNASNKTVDWVICRRFTTDDSGEKPVYIIDPFDIVTTPNAAPFSVSNGIVTGLHPSPSTTYPENYFVAAVSKEGSVVSQPCEVTVTEVVATGITISTKLTMPKNTKAALSAKPKPTGAYASSLVYESDNVQIVSVNSETGLMTANSAGVAIVTATLNGKFTGKITVTVTESLSATLKPGASKTFKLTGPATNADVDWTLTDIADSSNDLISSVDNPFTITENGSSAKVVCVTPKEAIYVLTATQYTVDENGDATTIPLYQMSWTIAAVTPITKLAMKQGEEVVKSVVLCVGPGKPNQTVDLTAAILNPVGATDLGYYWTVNKAGFVDIAPPSGADTGSTTFATGSDEGGTDNGGNNNQTTAIAKNDTIRVIALKIGSVQLSGINKNGNKKISLTVKIMYYPESITFRKGDTYRLPVGKSITLATVIQPARNVNKTLTWKVTKEDGSDTDVATVTQKGKVTAQKVGTIILTATGADGNVAATAKVDCIIPVKNVAINSSGETRIAVGDKLTLTAVLNPSNATLDTVTWTTNKGCVTLAPSDTNSAVCEVTASSVGSATITATTTEEKKKTITIRVIAAPAQNS